MTGRHGTLYEIFRALGESGPDHPAVLAPDRLPLTYGEFLRQTDRVRQTLNALGLGRGDRVALVLPLGPELAVCFAAVATCATAAPLNPSYRLNEFEFYLDDLHAEALIVPAGEDGPAVDVAQRRGISVIELAASDDGTAGRFTLDATPLRSPTAPGLAEAADISLVLHTSGTTARPKLVPLSQSNLCAAAENFRTWYALEPEDRALNFMPLFHIQGLLGGILAPLTAGSSIVCPSGFDADRFFDWLRDFVPTWYTAGPTFHQAILARAPFHRDSVEGHRLRFIRSSSAPLPPSVIAELERVFGSPVLEGYGMTESCLHSTSNPLPPALRKPGSVGPPAGIEVAVMDEAGELMPPDTTAEIVVRGPTVMGGYENAPDANASAFVRGWFRTGDLGRIDEDGYLWISGRLKEIINRGGEKIAPREVDDVLLSHPDVRQAIAFGVPHRNLGEDIGAAVVLKDGAEMGEQALRTFAAGRLADFKVPRRIVFVSELPTGATGKLSRTGLAQQLGLASEDGQESGGRSAYVAPRTSLETSLALLWAKVLEVDSVGIRDDFFDMGGYSLLEVQLVIEIERVLHRTLPPSILFECPTIEQLAQAIEAEHTPKPLVAIQPEGSRPPLFCIHDGQNLLVSYGNLIGRLSSEQPIFGLQPIWNGARELPAACVEDMARRYIREIQTVQPTGPYCLTGYSFGGLVAFEIARQLRAQNERVGLIALIDTYLPNAPSIAPPGLWLHRHLGALRQLDKGRLGYLLKRIQNGLHMLLVRPTKDGVFRLVLNACAKYGWTFPRFLYDPMAVNRMAMSEYKAGPYDGRGVLICAEPRASVHPDVHRGWTDVFKGGLEVHQVEGSHFDLIDSQHIAALAPILQACLDAAQSENGDPVHSQRR